MKFRCGRHIGFLTVSIAFLAALAGPAMASDSYQPSVVLSIGVDADSPIILGQPSDVIVNVSSDTVARADGLDGAIRLTLHDQVILTEPLRGSNTVTTTVPKIKLPKGTHVLTATYVPKPGSPYQQVSDTADIRVLNCKDDGAQNATDAAKLCKDGAGPKAGEAPTDQGGILPNTGGFWLGLLLLALLALAVGAELMRRSRRA